MYRLWWFICFVLLLCSWFVYLSCFYCKHVSLWRQTNILTYLVKVLLRILRHLTRNVILLEYVKVFVELLELSKCRSNYDKMRLAQHSKQTAVMYVSNLGQSESVDHTWRSCCWQHVQVIVIRGIVPELQKLGARPMLWVTVWGFWDSVGLRCTI